jgi:hypothetical protein
LRVKEKSNYPKNNASLAADSAIKKPGRPGLLDNLDINASKQPLKITKRS